MTQPILLLAGTAEARVVAEGLARGSIPVLASLSGATRNPQPLPVPTRVGGFGGDAGFEAFLDRAPLRAVIDATHPFAQDIGLRTARICAARRLPYLRLLRPPWRAGPGDDWRPISGPADAASMIPRGATVFLATGRQTLADWAPLKGRRVIARVIDPPHETPAFDGLEIRVGRPETDPLREAAFFRRERVGWVISKNAGGPANAKLAAARSLRLTVLMLPRPDPPPGATIVDSPDAALAWVAAL